MARALLEDLASELWELRLESLPREVVEEAVKAVVDTVSVTLAGFARCGLARSFAELVAPRLPSGPTVLGGWWSTAPHLAASANSFSAHCLELDDWLREGFVHAGCVVVPTALAFAEERGRTWAELLESVVLGYEVAARIGAAAGRRHYARWHTTSTAGCVAAAAVASRLLGLPAEEAAHAMATAAYYASGSWGFLAAGSSLKPVGPAHASLVGSVAAMLASRGLRTSTAALEGERGFFELMGGEDPSLVRSPRWRFAILRNGYKLYPCCRHTHTAVAAAIELRRRGVEPEDVEEVEIRTFSEAASIASHREPRTVEEARFSLTFVTCAALRYGRLGLDELEAALSDPLVRRLESSARVVVDESHDRAFPAEQPTTVRVRVRGSWEEATVRAPPGDPASPVGLDALLGKARSCVPRDQVGVVERLAELLTSGPLDQAVSLEALRSGRG